MINNETLQRAIMAIITKLDAHIVELADESLPTALTRRDANEGHILTGNVRFTKGHAGDPYLFVVSDNGRLLRSIAL